MMQTAEKSVPALLVTVEGLHGSLDLELPGDMAIHTIIAQLLQHPKMAHPSEALSPADWTLGLKGGQRFEAANSLQNYGVLEGSVLLLQPSAQWSNPLPVVEADLSLPNENKLLVLKGASSMFSSLFKKKK